MFPFLCPCLGSSLGSLVAVRHGCTRLNQHCASVCNPSAVSPALALFFSFGLVTESVVHYAFAFVISVCSFLLYPLPPDILTTATHPRSSWVSFETPLATSIILYNDFCATLYSIALRPNVHRGSSLHKEVGNVLVRVTLFSFQLIMQRPAGCSLQPRRTTSN